MTNALVVVNAVIVIPKLDDLVIAGGDEVLALGVDGERVELASLGTVEHADGLTIVAVPVGDLAIGARSQELGLIWVVDDLLEHSRLEEAHDTVRINDVPNDARAVI